MQSLWEAIKVRFGYFYIGFLFGGLIGGAAAITAIIFSLPFSHVEFVSIQLATGVISAIIGERAFLLEMDVIVGMFQRKE